MLTKKTFGNICVQKLFFTLLLSLSCAFGWAAPESTKAIASALKTRQPHWRPKIMESYPEGQPSRVLFYEQMSAENEAPVKQVYFYPSGQIKTEMDLIVVAEDTPAAKEWKSTIVPHGMCVSFFSNGQIERVAGYDRGVLHGDLKVYYENGKLHGECTFKQGERHGKMASYFEAGPNPKKSS